MYSMEEKTNFFLCFQQQKLPIDLINKIWIIHLELKKEKQKCPDAPKKISTRTLSMMERWNQDGRSINPVPRVLFSL
jgi:hypothetical protein